MDIFTTGRIYNKGYRLNLVYLPKDLFLADVDLVDCYKAIFIEKGSGIAEINSKKCIFTAPCIFCLNESETISFSRKSDFSLRSLCFHPGIINKIFTFHNVNDQNSQLSVTDFQDTYWIKLFTDRTHSYIGLLNIGPSLLKRILDIYNSINSELEEQRDFDWPCRSRSYLFELLIMLQRVLSDEHSVHNTMISARYPEIAEIILFFHTNYMKKITISELSKVFNINRTTMGSQFIEATGLSIISYLIKLRIEVASMIIRDTLLPFKEVMERVGFIDRAHFNRLFSKYTGYTPGEYRKKYGWM